MDTKIATVSSDIGTLAADIKTLSDQVAAGGGAASAADLDAFVARLAQAGSTLDTMHSQAQAAQPGPPPPTP
jgi:outer membrane murein-binding lipoprotein Lpp